jgi:ribonuclease HI
MNIELDDPEVISIFSDGSCWPTGNGKGGWAFEVRFRGEREHRCGAHQGVSNNAMELMAIVRALQFIPVSCKHTRPLIIATDSAYAMGALSLWVEQWEKDGWRTGNGKPVSNLAIVQLGHALIKHHRTHRHVEFRKVKGHVGVARNELVDVLAGNARRSGKGNWNEREDVRTHPL